jgi:hypothetical protein
VEQITKFRFNIHRSLTSLSLLCSTVLKCHSFSQFLLALSLSTLYAKDTPLLSKLSSQLLLMTDSQSFVSLFCRLHAMYLQLMDSGLISICKFSPQVLPILLIPNKISCNQDIWFTSILSGF